ncbi:hypothetical protein ACIG3E_32565 [Streptomyces sp. NPDC053474]|uniref:hypothetical protein n=1 Tax=Streptomyces sp. NPDC053474 TaxID=3365704 RepID=UPI0037D610C3
MASSVTDRDRVFKVFGRDGLLDYEAEFPAGTPGERIDSFLRRVADHGKRVAEVGVPPVSGEG